MTTDATSPPTRREPELLGQIVVVIGGSAGIGLETARRARAEGADVILTGRDPERLNRGALDVDARSTAAFDANDAVALRQFFDGLPDRIDHVMVTGPGPDYASMLEMDAEGAPGDRRPRGAGARGRPQRRRQDEARRDADLHGRHRRPEDQPRARARLRGDRRATSFRGHPCARARSDSRQPHRRRLRRHTAVDVAARRSTRGRREELRTTLRISRVVGPPDVAALAVHIMTNTALTGATYDIDGGQQFVSG
jgi:hypothetical protein